MLVVQLKPTILCVRHPHHWGLLQVLAFARSGKLSTDVLWRKFPSNNKSMPSGQRRVPRRRIWDVFGGKARAIYVDRGRMY